MVPSPPLAGEQGQLTCAGRCQSPAPWPLDTPISAVQLTLPSSHGISHIPRLRLSCFPRRFLLKARREITSTGMPPPPHQPCFSERNPNAISACSISCLTPVSLEFCAPARMDTFRPQNTPRSLPPLPSASAGPSARHTGLSSSPD